jgi:hypothetical protein
MAKAKKFVSFPYSTEKAGPGGMHHHTSYDGKPKTAGSQSCQAQAKNNTLSQK